MSIKYNQILNDGSVVLAEDRKYLKKVLFDRFKDTIKKNGYKINHSSKVSESPTEIILMDEREFLTRIVVYIKNITGAGWKDKPSRKRVQVGNVRYNNPDKYISTYKHQTLFILGYYNYDNNPIYVAWDLYRYTKHKTQRSCYVDIQHLFTGYETGFIRSVSSDNVVWIFTELYFDKFLNDYIDYITESTFHE